VELGFRLQKSLHYQNFRLGCVVPDEQPVIRPIGAILLGWNGEPETMHLENHITLADTTQLKTCKAVGCRSSAIAIFGAKKDNLRKNPGSRHRQNAKSRGFPRLVFGPIGAGEGIRTLDPNLGKRRIAANILIYRAVLALE
jgi:hypothetical protein